MYNATSVFVLFFFFNLFIYLPILVLIAWFDLQGFGCFTPPFSVCKQKLFSSCGAQASIAVASLVAKHRL